MKRQMMFFFTLLFIGLAMSSCDKDEEKVCDCEVVEIKEQDDYNSAEWDDVVKFKDETITTEHPDLLRDEAELTQEEFAEEFGKKDTVDCSSGGSGAVMKAWFQCKPFVENNAEAKLDDKVHKVRECN